MSLTTLRRKIPVLQNALYLNTGTFGPLPTEVLNEIRYVLDLIERYGAFLSIVRQNVEQKGVADSNPTITLQNFAEQLSAGTRLVFASYVSGINVIRLATQPLPYMIRRENMNLAPSSGRCSLVWPVPFSSLGILGCQRLRLRKLIWLLKLL